MDEFISAYFSSAAADNMSVGNTLIIIAFALLLGLIISLTCVASQKKTGYSQSFVTSLVILPAIIAIIILLVGNSVARAFSLAGAFTLVRYRSAPGNPRDITFIFLTLAIGLACGLGYIGYAIILTIIICAVILLLSKLGYGAGKVHAKQLKILMPENLNHEGLFDDIFSKYLRSFKLRRIKTTDFGSLFELTYIVEVRPDINEKEFVDELRTRNGNLNISLTLKDNEESEYHF